MPNRKLFVNLPVQDLDKSVEFFTKLGFEFDPLLTDASASGMAVSEDACVMLLVRPFFSGFTTKEIADTATQVEAILCVSAASRDEVDTMVAAALEAGGAPAGDKMDEGPMYGWSFQDLDGHVWEVVHMDLEAASST